MHPRDERHLWDLHPSLEGVYPQGDPAGSVGLPDIRMYVMLEGTFSLRDYIYVGNAQTCFSCMDYEPTCVSSERAQSTASNQEIQKMLSHYPHGIVRCRILDSC